MISKSYAKNKHKIENIYFWCLTYKIYIFNNYDVINYCYIS